MKIEYTKVGDYYLPNLVAPENMKNFELENRVKSLESEINNLNNIIKNLEEKIGENNIINYFQGKSILVIGDEGRKVGYCRHAI